MTSFGLKLHFSVQILHFFVLESEGLSAQKMKSKPLLGC